MTLGLFASIVGAAPRWVQNAYQALGLDPNYNEDRARVLGLARLFTEALRIPVVEAWPLARQALAVWPDQEIWQTEDEAGVVTLEVNLKRYLSSYGVRLSLARTRSPGKKRGRPPKRRKRGVAGAREYGLDIDLLRESLKRTPKQRLRQLDADVEFVRSLRVAEP